MRCYRSSAYKTSTCYIALLIFAIAHAHGQSWQAFKDLRYDDDYSHLESDSCKNLYKRAKRLVTGPAVFSFGGELRMQFFKINNEDFGSTSEGSDSYSLTRYLFHTNISYNRFRVFSQLQGGDAAWKKSVSPVDQNHLDLHQLFADYHLRSSRFDIILRIGRQELLYGFQRLISVREGPNYRQAFDGLKFRAASRGINLDAFYTQHVVAKSGIFNDRSSSQLKLWGLYTMMPNVSIWKTIDVYYLGYQRHHAVFENISGQEMRHSLGARLRRDAKLFFCDAEWVWQFGQVGTQSIRAWTASADIIFKWPGMLLQPELGLKSELISGDKVSSGHTIETFNSLFPRGGYFGLAARFGPSNLLDVHPSLQLTITPELSVNFEYDAFWRYSTSDGLYSVPGTQLHPGGKSSSRYIGDQFSIALNFDPNNFISCTAEAKWFETGSYLKTVTPGKNILFIMTQARIRF